MPAGPGRMLRRDRDDASRSRKMARGDGTMDRGGTSSKSTGRGGGGYEYYKNLALELASLEPQMTLQKLDADDPFGTRMFDAELVRRETEFGRVLDMNELIELFPCPVDERRITLPDVRMEGKARDFRNGRKGTFLFFQHLRKVRAPVVYFAWGMGGGGDDIPYFIPRVGHCAKECILHPECVCVFFGGRANRSRHANFVSRTRRAVRTFAVWRRRIYRRTRVRVIIACPTWDGRGTRMPATVSFWVCVVVAARRGEDSRRARTTSCGRKSTGLF
jgi:hypothetical protein